MNHFSLPKVSVSIITYNHEHYIAKAIDSVLMQKVNFDYEIIIGDDYSKDGTREILKSYQQKYPDIIQLILHPRDYDEIPGRTNNMTNLYACRGQYIAMLDGDDYWISENKLQTQVDVLDQHPEYTISTHQACVVDEYENKITIEVTNKKTLKYENFWKQEEILMLTHPPAATSSFFFRNHIIKSFPDWFTEVISADYAILLLLTDHGDCHFADNVFSAYRKHQRNFMLVHFYEKESIQTKIWELSLYLELFLKKKAKNKFQYYRISNRAKKRISQLKYIYANMLLKDGMTTQSFRTILGYAKSDFFIYYASQIALKNAGRKIGNTFSKQKIPK